MTLVGRGGAHVVMNLAARAARTSVAHGPEIFFQAGNRKDSVRRNILGDPKTFCFLIDSQFVAGETSAPPNTVTYSLSFAIANHSGEVISSHAKAIASFLK